MKKILAVVLFSLSVSPLFAADAAAPAAPAAAAPAAAAPAADNAAPAAAPKAKKAAMKTGDEAGIKKTFKEWGESWAAGDAKALSGFFLPDGSLITPAGEEANGRAEIEKILGANLAMMKGSTHSVDNYKFHFVLSGFALVDATGTISGLKNADGTVAPDMTSHIYAALALRGSKWYFLALRPYAFLKMGAAAAPAAPMAPAAPAPAAAVPTTSANVTVPAAK